MKLLEHLKTDRARRKEKKPLPETVFTVVAAIVQRFGLTSVPGAGGPGELPPEKPRSARLSLFPLLNPAQFRLTREIIARFDNPYLSYARSPEDFWISLLLHRSNPHLVAPTLEKFPLGQLLALEARGEPEGQLEPQSGGEVFPESFSLKDI
jgi:hypothetical protein